MSDVAQPGQRALAQGHRFDNILVGGIARAQFGDTINNIIHENPLPTVRGAAFDSYDNEHLSTCLPNTRVELLHQVIEWADDAHGKGIFWLSGIAGTGKSTVAGTVAQALRKKGQLGASFFFKRGEASRGKANRFFTTIADQLTRRIPALVPETQQAIADNPRNYENSLTDQFSKFVFGPLTRLSQVPSRNQRLIIVVDALDECDGAEDVERILTLLARAKDIAPISLRIFLASRPEIPIRFGFKDMAEGVYQDFVLHEVPRPLIGHDIALYFKHEFAQIKAHRSVPPNWPGDKSIQDLVEMAIALFIFAVTVCHFIREDGGRPQSKLNEFLKYRSRHNISNMDKTYLPIVAYLSNKDWGRWRQSCSRILRHRWNDCHACDSTLNRIPRSASRYRQGRRRVHTRPATLCS